MPRHLVCLVLALGIIVCTQAQADPIESYAAAVMASPQTRIKSHTVGNLKLVISNWGFFGNRGQYDVYEWSCEFPANSGQDYLFQGGLWIGGVVEGETLVSAGADGWLYENELFPGSSPGDTIVERSSDTLSPYYHPDAVSEQDLIAVYTDTVGPPYAPPEHVPIGLKITQETYCWTHNYLKDFIIMNYMIENIRGDGKTINDLYLGLYIDADVTPVTDIQACRWYAAQDDITGFRAWKDESDTLWSPGTKLYEWDGTQYVEVDVAGTPKYQSPCEYTTVAWAGDEDGIHPGQACPGMGIANSVTGTRLICLPQERISYNWWISDSDSSADYGPCNPLDPNDVCGTPMGDSLKYRIMSNGYIDPDQVCDSLEYPPGVDSINDTRYLLSLGPNDLPAGETLQVVLAYLGGEHFHDGNPWCEWSFEDLAANASWAYAVCDNPGVDTDTNGYAGDFIITAGDTFFVSGDGIPDFRISEDWPANPCEVPIGVAERFMRPRAWKFQLRQNFPNPFSRSTRIAFTIPTKGDVRLDVYDVCGRLVSRLVDGETVPGRYEYDWDGLDSRGRRVANGVYFCRLSTGENVSTREMVVLK